MSRVPGLLALMGSGETSLAGGRIFERVAAALPPAPRIAVLETPAGFELNSAQVAGRVAEYLNRRLQNYRPQITVVPARKRGTPFSPDDPQVIAPLFSADLIFMGPGSPTYAIRQLQGTLAWDVIRARHRQGAALVFASAATIAVGAFSLPVYEIYKVGEDVHICPGLNLPGDYGLALSFIPHWNNTDGGEDVDTSRCFVGRERFAAWQAQLPPGQSLLGMDEHTGVVFDFAAGCCQVLGVSTVTVETPQQHEIYPAGTEFPLDVFGSWRMPPDDADLNPDALTRIAAAMRAREAASRPPDDVLALAERRLAARRERNWAAADRLRAEIAALGWEIRDTPDGFELERRQP